MAKHDFYDPIDLHQKELLNARLQALIDLPEDPFEGQVCYASNVGKRLGALFNGIEWLYFGFTEEKYLQLLELTDPTLENGITKEGAFSYSTATSANASGWEGLINGNEVESGAQILNPIEGTPTLYDRIDIAVLNLDNSIEYIAGEENSEGAVAPATPEDTLLIVEALRRTNGTNEVYLTPEDALDYVIKSFLGNQLLQGDLQFAKQSGNPRGIAVFDVNGKLRNQRADYVGVYSSIEGVGATSWSKLVTINGSVTNQLRYFCVLEFAGISPTMEKGAVWVQFQVDSGGEMVNNRLKVFGEIKPEKLKLVRVDEYVWDLYVHHNEAAAFFKFRPEFSFGSSEKYTYFHQAGLTPLPSGGAYDTQYDFEDATRPNQRTYEDEAELFGDQDRQKKGFQYLVDGEQKIYIYLGTTAETIADYLVIGGGGGGGADTNAVHYNSADGKTATEQQRARDNVGLNGIATDYTLVSNNHNWARPTNYIRITLSGFSLRSLTGMQAGLDGEIVLISVRGTGRDGQILQESTSSTDVNRFSFEKPLVKGEEFLVIYNIEKERWDLLIDLSRSQADELYIKRAIYNTMTAGIRISATPGNLSNWNQGFPFTIRSGTDTYSRAIVAHFNTSGGFIYYIRSTGEVYHQRSSVSDESIRRDEQRLYYPSTINTAGVVNNMPITAGIFNYRLTSATSITGIESLDIGSTIDIDNNTGSSLTLQNENAGSISANRIKIIGGADLVIPIDGKVTLKYCTGSRWELVSKNF